MISAKTGIKLLKHLGIVLISLPEPITTPLGIGFILTSRYLSQRLEASLNKHFRESLKLYMAHFKRSTAEANAKSGDRSRTKRSTRSKNRMVPQQNKPNLSVIDNPLILFSKSRNDAADNSIKHTVDMPWLSRRYGNIAVSQVTTAGSAIAAESNSTEKLIHHSPDMQMLSRRFKTDVDSKAETNLSEPSDVTPAIHHSPDMRMLSICYKTADSSKHKSEGSDTAGSPELVTHHKINLEALSRRFKGEDRIEVESIPVKAAGEGKGVTRQPVNRRLLPRQYELDSLPSVKTNHHTINMASLQRLYGSTVSNAPASKRLSY